MSNIDQRFIKQAALGNMFEIAISELAVARSSDSFVTEYAKEMVNEHKLSLEELRNVAEGKGITLPDQLPTFMLNSVTRLSNLRGDAFDSAFQQVQNSAHSGASMKFKAEIQNGNDEDVKAYTVKALPLVELHFRLLTNKQTMMGPTKMQNNG